jgi:photosystem II stability/assembly factor-like uncharacterized protein
LTSAGVRLLIRGAAIAWGWFLALASFGGSVHAQWTSQDSGTRARLRGVSVVDDRTVWASGSQGTAVMTTNAGASWRRLTMPGAADRDFRDVHAVDARAAFVLSIGPGELSRVERTTDGGTTWRVSLTNPDQRGFFDAIAFWDGDHGLVQGDPVENRFTIFASADGGDTWHRAKPPAMPLALAGEGAFAASGTSLVVNGAGHAWFGTGGALTARVFRSEDQGGTWTVAETPIPAGNSSSGIFSLAFRDASHGVAVGGDYQQPDRGGRIAARTDDGGRSWSLPKGTPPRAFRSAVAYLPESRTPTLIAVGPTGADVSSDDGENWKPLGSAGFHALGFASPTTGWAVGEEGKIARFTGVLRP